ncbi:unnamed protein product, partial [Sphacelaria rigidula]
VTVSGQHVYVTERTVLMQLTLSTSWGPAQLPPISFVIMPGSDGVILMGLPTLQELGVDARRVVGERGAAVERSVKRGLEMLMIPAKEESARKVALEESVTDAGAAGLTISKAERLRGILHRRVNVFRRPLRGDPPARVEPMQVQLKPGASAAKTKPRRYDPVKSSWLALCTAALLALGLVLRNLQAGWSSRDMAFPKK